jgi:hypothetical protein
MLGEENREKVPEKSISIIHHINNYIKLLYAYFANFKYSKKRAKNHSIVGKVNFWQLYTSFYQKLLSLIHQIKRYE